MVRIRRTADTATLQNGGATIFWLVFKKHNKVAVIIQPAGDIIAARMRAMLAGIKGDFQEGHEMDAKMIKKIPNAQIGKVLSRTQANALLKILDR